MCDYLIANACGYMHMQVKTLILCKKVTCNDILVPTLIVLVLVNYSYCYVYLHQIQQFLMIQEMRLKEESLRSLTRSIYILLNKY